MEMQTLLEFACGRLMGPPTARRCNGDSQWPCRKCGHPKWHTLPHSDEHPHQRFNCFRCGWRGDLCDLLLFFYSRETYEARLARIDAISNEGGFDAKVDHRYRVRGTAQNIRPAIGDSAPCSETEAEEQERRWTAFYWSQSEEWRREVMEAVGERALEQVKQTAKPVKAPTYPTETLLRQGRVSDERLIVKKVYPGLSDDDADAVAKSRLIAREFGIDIVTRDLAGLDDAHFRGYLLDEVGLR
jgi:hypothetical protein